MASSVEERPARHSRRFEGISLVYLVFFVLAVLAPSIITRDYFGIKQAHLEEVLIFLLGLASLATVAVYERQMEKRIRERNEAAQSAERAMKELVESYKYIGSMNRQMEVLKKLTNETSISLVKSDAYWKDLLQSLAKNAAACAGADRVLIRFVDLTKLRTEREVFFCNEGKKQIAIPNKELKKMAEEKSKHVFLRVEGGEEMLVVPSDKKDSSIKAHVIVPAESRRITDMEISLIKVLANQAELIYHSLIQDKVPATPLQLMENVTADSVGEIS